MIGRNRPQRPRSLLITTCAMLRAKRASRRRNAGIAIGIGSVRARLTSITALGPRRCRAACAAGAGGGQCERRPARAVRDQAAAAEAEARAGRPSFMSLVSCLPIMSLLRSLSRA